MGVKLTNVFARNAEAYRTGAKLVINQGGQGSSKTYSILQLLYLIAKYHGPKRITIASYALPHLRSGVVPDFERIITDFGDNPGAIKNKSDMTYHLPNGSLIEFYGVEGNTAKAHGPRRDILFINECNRKITYEVFDQLNTRTQETTFLDFNPDIEFWLHDKVTPFFEHTLIKSNFIDNPYLPEKERQNILMKRDKPGFEMWWQVYGLGELGRLEGAILGNWKYGSFDKSLPYGYGLDFGFSDPDAMVKVAIDHKRMIIYADEMIYKSGNSADALKGILKGLVTPHEQIIADCADARMIANLRREFNIMPVNKAKWTVVEALKLMQGYEIIITERSFNLAKELNNYIWDDKRAEKPIDDFNHLIDAMRYYFVRTMSSQGVKVW